MQNYEFEMFISEAGIYNAEIHDGHGHPLDLIDVLKAFEEWSTKRRAEEQQQQQAAYEYSAHTMTVNENLLPSEHA